MITALRLPVTDATASWRQSLTSGAPGITLLHIEHGRAGHIGWDMVHHWAAAMTHEPVTAHPGSSLFEGAPAVAFALSVADHPAYQTALSTLDDHIVDVVRHRLARAHMRIDQGRRPALCEFDLISGLTGLGAYLLRRPGRSWLLAEVLGYVVRLTEPVTVDGMVLPGWWTEHGPADQRSPHWPGGHANLGIAHGIAGPLALLATSMRHGITVPGQSEAIEWICAWLDLMRCGTPDRPWWPETVSTAEYHRDAMNRPGPRRPSWCYGTPGLARAQQLAGIALGRPELRRAAEAALVSCLSDATQLAQLTDLSLCHGWAGVVQTAWRAARTAGPDSALAALLPTLRAQFAERSRHDRPHHDGLLDGAAGIELARHATRTGWDACLLIAD